MREVIASGKTVEEATENGCRELGLSRDEVSVEILEMPVRKLFKTSPAQVKVTADTQPEEQPQKPQEKPVQKSKENAPKTSEKPHKKHDKTPASAAGAVLPTEPEVQIDLGQNAAAAAAVAYLTDIFSAMGAGEFAVTAFQQGDATLLRIEGEGIADVMETRGDTVQALSYLADRAVNKGVDKKDGAYLRIRLDIAGYRGRRESELVRLATRTGEEVQRTKRSKTLSPMNPYERLIIHTTISSMEGLVSESIGSDSERRVVIKSTAPDATDGEDWRAPRRGGAPRSGQNRGRSGGNNRRRDNSDRRDRPRGGGPREQRSNTPEREYAGKEVDPNAAPVVPERREAIKDGEDLPLYGKIEI